MKHYLGSIIFTAIVLLGAGLIGFYNGGAVALVSTILVLAILETSLSFDNAIVNAKVLEGMSVEWRGRFLTWGMVIAVFGMRVVFPLLIVSLASGIGMIEALNLAITNPHQYAVTLQSADVLIKGFGGAFLLLVALNFFFDQEKDNHWIKPIETALLKIGALKSMSIIVTLLTLYAFSRNLGEEETVQFLVSGLFGIIVHELVGSIGDLLGTEDAEVTVAKAGLASFLYLECLDASFSMDSAIGALVISTNIFVIAAGLGVGAMFVRSMTIHLVDSGTLNEYKYLENGAFWSIFALAFIMFFGVHIEIPEIVTGGLAVGLIGTALVHSIYTKGE